jgi:tetratricopeptide (TPR) repeat protein
MEACPDGASALPSAISPGYVFLQAGRLPEAIQALQADIARNPHHAVLYGYLGDAYWLQGQTKAARQCYREACLIDPAAIDWRHVRDTHLQELRQELLLIHGSDPELAVAWLPSHGRMDGLFERREVRLHDGLKEMVEDYLLLNKAFLKEKSALLGAKLFYKGMVLCENEESLRFVKKVDLVQVRRMMKQANPDLFADFLEWIEAGAGR